MLLRKIFFISISFFIFYSCVFAQSALWQKVCSLPDNSRIQTIAAHPKNSTLIYMGTERSVYRFDTAAKKLQGLLTLSTSENGVNFIWIDLTKPGHMAVAANSGLYESWDDGQNWQRVYLSSDPQEARCFTFLQEGEISFLGTGRGVFLKGAHESSWHPLSGGLNKEAIYYSSRDEDFLYFASDAKVWRFEKKSRQLMEIYSTGTEVSSEEEDQEYQEEASGEDFTDTHAIRFLTTARLFRADYVFLAASQGILYSTDHGQNWQKFPSNHFPLEELTALIVFEKPLKSATVSATDEQEAGAPALQESQASSPLVISFGYGPDAQTGNILDVVSRKDSVSQIGLLAATHQGVFLYSDGKWAPFYQGLETNTIEYLSYAEDKNIYAATNSGIFYFSVEKAFSDTTFLTKADAQPQTDLRWVQQQFSYEPSIRTLHDWAVDYAEVNPKKIETWRDLASKRAVMPSLSFGLNRGDTDLYHWDSNSTSVADELRKGKDFVDWDVSVSWDLADLIWNPDQTSIDTRSKLMVEMREDILDQITRLYFERRRVQMELVMANEAPSALDQTVLLDKEMRVEELTALLDGYTGGRFSQAIEENLRKMREGQGCGSVKRCIKDSPPLVGGVRGGGD